MRRRGCDDLAELRSAYLDGALEHSDRERVVAHLLNCAPCRNEVDELRTVRELLGQMGRNTVDAPAGNDLSSRLVSIAGGEAYEPVWSRPFRRTSPGALPSARRALRLKTTAAALALGGVLSAVGLAGYAAAPPLESVALGDPSERVRSEFAATLTQFPLTSRSINALMMASTSELLTRAHRPLPARSSTMAKLPVTDAAALAVLRRAADHSDQVSYTGTQQVLASNRGRTISATVQIAARAEQGSAVRVYDQRGRQLVNGFVPSASSLGPAQDRVGQDRIALLAQNYLITGWVGSTVVGRPATVVEATARQGSGRPAARWWVDNGTGLLLWQETYDEAGGVALAAGFTSVRISSKPEFLEHLAPRLAISTTTASLNLSHVSELASRGWYCRGELAGLSLVRLRSDELADPDALHLVYSDGVSSLSVFEQRGVLSAAPAGSRWDQSLGAFVTAGTPTMATWQSGDRVITVVTDGPEHLVDQAVRTLPHAVVMTRTTMERVRAGWARILERVVR